MELNYTPQSEGNAALATGIIGTGLGAMNLLGNLGNFWNTEKSNVAGYHNGVSSCDHVVNRYELETQFAYQKELMAKDLKISELQSEKISDQKDIELYKQIKSELNALEARYDAQLGNVNNQLAAQAVQNQANSDTFRILDSAIQRETATRKANDRLIVNYANSTFVPKVVMTTTYTDATIGSSSGTQPTYDPLPACDCND